MSFLRSMWKNNSKHKKLCEELALANSIRDFSENHEEIDESSDDAITYIVKYIGQTPVKSSRSEQTTSSAVKKIISKSNKKLQRVSLAISPKGIEMSDHITGENLLQVSIYRISYCSADASHSHVFAFIESCPKSEEDQTEMEKNAFTASESDNEDDGKLICHAFLCQKRKMAQTVTLTVARSFERAYQVWQNHQWQMERKNKNKKNESVSNKQVTTIKNDEQHHTELIDLNTDLVEKDAREYLQNTWISFEDDTADEFHQIAARNLSMTPGWDMNVLCS